MITIAVVWLCLATHVAYGTVITVSSNGDNTTDCCENGMCLCSCLSSALRHMQSNMVINIVSNITLYDNVHIGSGNLNNITIAGIDVIITCNNTGAMYCESCRNVVIMGITWYQCGTSFSNNTSIPALHFNIVSNMIIKYCTFHNSPSCPVHLDLASGSIIINGSNFIANAVDSFNTSCAGLYIYYKRNLDISVYASKFDRNGCRLPNSCNHYSAIIFSLDEAFAMSNIDIKNTIFSYNSRALFMNFTIHTSTVKLSNVTVWNNTMGGILIGNSYQYIDFPDIEISSSAFVNNVNPLTIILPPKEFTVVSLITVEIKDSIFSNNIAISNNDTGVTTNFGVLSLYYHPGYSVTIANCYFYNNFNGAIDMQLISPVSSPCLKPMITFRNVTICNTTIVDDSDASVSIASVETFIYIQFTDVNFILNRHSSHNGEVLLITNSNLKCMGRNISIQFVGCKFDDNTALGDVVALKIMRNVNDPSNNALFNITNCTFNNNYGGNSIVNIQGPTSVDSFSHVTLVNSTFSNNRGTALYCIFTYLKFQENIFFINNTAISGSAIYFKQILSVLSDNANIQFISNSAVQRGGALYFNLIPNDYCNIFPDSFNASFVNNSADIAGNSIYFGIPQSCQISTATTTNSSLLYVPSEFSYSQSPYIMGSPVVTSPHNIKLYPPAEIAIHNSSNAYFIQQSIMLGEPIQFTGSALGHFNSVTEIVIFDINCNGCGNDYVLSTYQIAVHNKSLIELKVFPTTQSDVTDNVNISLTFLSVLPPIYRSITASLSVELSPCHIGYLFDKYQRQCICYPHHDIQHCTDDYIEIKLGYWVGYVSDHYTSSICPSDYCSFSKQTETSLGYYGLSRQSDVSTDDQCNSHRTGIACGKCKPGYTLAYDSPDCINTNKWCSAGMTILVLVLTILYWIAVVAIVFSLMWLPFQKASALGYVFGIIYFYSIVDILLVNDVSKEVNRLVAILSSLAKLTPKLFGQLCFVEGLSGIDQQFIHYCHALAISLILLAIVLVARISPRLLMHVNRHIIGVICILLLLSYTSLASTSLQLLRPLIFNDVDEVFTYSSPDIKYFTGRHLVYAITALLCEMIIVIGFPLLLLLEPLLSRKVNFVRIKPLMDPFQHCYKDKYRWFAAYYLICRQVLILIVYIGNINYYNMLYYLQTACIIIAMIHGYIQPYKSNLLNGLDGLILLIMVLVVNLNTFPSFSLSVSSGLSVVLVILPLLLFCFTVIRRFLSHCYKRKKVASLLINPAEGDDNHERRYIIRCSYMLYSF